MNERGEIVTHLEYIFDHILKLLKYDIMSLWIFDGKQPTIKREELTRRKLDKLRIQKEYEESIVYDPNSPIHQKNFTISKDILG